MAKRKKKSTVRIVTDDEYRMIQQIRKGDAQVIPVLLDYVLKNERHEQTFRDAFCRIVTNRNEEVQRLERIPLERYTGSWSRHQFVAREDRTMREAVLILYWGYRRDQAQPEVKPEPTAQDLARERVEKANAKIAEIDAKIKRLQTFRKKWARRVAANYWRAYPDGIPPDPTAS